MLGSLVLILGSGNKCRVADLGHYKGNDFLSLVSDFLLSILHACNHWLEHIAEVGIRYGSTILKHPTQAFLTSFRVVLEDQLAYVVDNSWSTDSLSPFVHGRESTLTSQSVFVFGMIDTRHQAFFLKL